MYSILVRLNKNFEDLFVIAEKEEKQVAISHNLMKRDLILNIEEV